MPFEELNVSLNVFHHVITLINTNILLIFPFCMKLIDQRPILLNVSKIISLFFFFYNDNKLSL